MSSPFRKHQASVRARLLAASAGDIAAPDRPDDSPDATEYALLRQQLGEHMRQLSQIQSTEAKAEAKRAMVPVYADHIDAAIAAGIDTGKAVQDEIVARMMIWSIDIGDYDRALTIAEHVLRFGLQLPEPFKRSAAAIVAEQIAQAALVALGQAQPFDITVLQRTLALTQGHDMHDQVRAKLHKALGFAFRLTADTTEGEESGVAGGPAAARHSALAHLRRALELDPQVGVKKDIERLVSRIGKD